MAFNNKFLTSTVTTSDIATETTLKDVLTLFESGGANPVVQNVQTNGLADKVQIAISDSDITGSIPVSVSTMTITDVDTSGIQTDNLIVQTQTEVFPETDSFVSGNAIHNAVAAVRNESRSTLAGTELDYCPISTSKRGELLIEIADVKLQSQTHNLGVAVNNLVSVNQTSIGATAEPISANTGDMDDGTQRVCIAANNTVSTTVTTNNLTAIKSTDISVNSGDMDDGTQRVCIATNNALSTIVAANNLTTINGTTLATGDSASGPGVQSVQIVNDQPAIEIKSSSDISTVLSDVQLVYSDNIQTHNLNVNSNNWVVLASSYFSPFIDRFVNFQGVNSTDANSAYFTETASSSFAIVRTANKFRLQPNSTIEVIFSVKGSYETNGNSNDYIRFGLFSEQRSVAGTYPKSSFCIEGNATYGSGNQWISQVFHANINGSSAAGSFSTTATDTDLQTFKFIIKNNAVPVMYVYQLDQSTDHEFNYCNRVVGASPMESTEFYFGAEASCSSPVITSIEMKSFHIRENAGPFQMYRELPVSYGFAYLATVALDESSQFALSGIRLDPTVSQLSTVWIKSIDVVCGDNNELAYISIYKNPTLSAAHTWSITEQRVQFSTLIDTITVTSGTPIVLKVLESFGSPGGSLNIELPHKTLGLFDVDDEIYIVGTSLSGNNTSLLLSWNYEL